MPRVVDLSPDVRTVPHPFRVLWLRGAHVEAHLEVFVLGPVLDDAFGEVIPGTLKFVLEIACAPRREKTVKDQGEPCGLNQSWGDPISQASRLSLAA